MTFFSSIVGLPDYYSYLAGYVKVLFDDIFEFREELKNFPAFGFITHGGGGKTARVMEKLLKSIKLNAIYPVISVLRDEITAENETQIEENCRKMLELL
ncbi:MAG: hypothetical protein ACTSWY_06205 [Promethearchaeota archaeon]